MRAIAHEDMTSSSCLFVWVSQMQPELDEKRFGMLPLTQVEAFYRSYHSYLKKNGVDGVKVGMPFPSSQVVVGVMLTLQDRPQFSGEAP